MKVWSGKTQTWKLIPSNRKKTFKELDGYLNEFKAFVRTAKLQSFVLQSCNINFMIVKFELRKVPLNYFVCHCSPESLASFGLYYSSSFIKVSEFEPIRAVRASK